VVRLDGGPQEPIGSERFVAFGFIEQATDDAPKCRVEGDVFMQTLPPRFRGKVQQPIYDPFGFRPPRDQVLLAHSTRPSDRLTHSGGVKGHGASR